MSQQKVIYKTVRFRPSGAGSSQTVKPSLNSSDDIGTVLSISTSIEREEAVFEKPVSGKWVDYDAVNQRQREITTVTVGELSETFWELYRGATFTLPGGTYTPGSTVTFKGWFEVILTDDSNTTLDTVDRWCKIDITSVEHPQTGYNQAVFTVRTLYSAVATGTFANIA